MQHQHNETWTFHTAEHLKMCHKCKSFRTQEWNLATEASQVSHKQFKCSVSQPPYQNQITKRMRKNDKHVLLVNVLSMNNTNNNTYLAHTERKSDTHTHTYWHTYLRPILHFHHFLTFWNKISNSPHFEAFHLNKIFHYLFTILIKPSLTEYKTLFCNLLFEKPQIVFGAH